MVADTLGSMESVWKLMAKATAAFSPKVMEDVRAKPGNLVTMHSQHS